MKEVTLKLEGVKDLPNNEYEYTYIDEQGNKIVFVETNKAFTYMLDFNKTSSLYGKNKIMNRAINAYIQNSMKRYEFEGGYEEAISKITIKV